MCIAFAIGIGQPLLRLDRGVHCLHLGLQLRIVFQVLVKRRRCFDDDPVIFRQLQRFEDTHPVQFLKLHLRPQIVAHQILDRLYLVLVHLMIGNGAENAKAGKQPHIDAKIILRRPDMQRAFGCGCRCFDSRYGYRFCGNCWCSPSLAILRRQWRCHKCECRNRSTSSPVDFHDDPSFRLCSQEAIFFSHYNSKNASGAVSITRAGSFPSACPWPVRRPACRDNGFRASTAPALPAPSRRRRFR
jgi:hypothetical protein